MKHIGQCIRVIRTMREWTQETLGSEAGGIPQSRISCIERGDRFYVDELLALARALRCDAAELLRAIPPNGTIQLVVRAPERVEARPAG